MVYVAAPLALREVDEIDVVVATLSNAGKPPAELGVTHWSSRLLGTSFSTVAKIWRKWDIQPHRVETFTFSTDPQFEAKLRDVVGLYLDPPLGAVVVSVMPGVPGRPTTTSATAPPPCSPRWRSPPGRSAPTPATSGTPTSSS